MTPEELFKRIDITKIYPKFYQNCMLLVYNCTLKGYNYYAISGFRDPLEQEKLYNIGRTIDLDKKPVTNAQPFKSYHNFGLAIDFSLDKDINRNGLQPSWNIDDYKLLADEAVKLGLQPGFYFKSFKEGPHIQFTLPKHLNLQTLENVYKNESIEAVWKLF